MSFIDALAISALESSAADNDDSSAECLDLGGIRRQVKALVRDDAHLTCRLQPDAQPSPSPSESAPALVGELLEHRYRIVRLLGTGSISSLYEAVHVALDRRVAVRVLHPGFASEAHFRKRFAREVTCAAKLRHPSIVQIMDFGVVEWPMYFVMELLEGCDLKTLLRQQRRLPWSRAREILLQAVVALDAAHRYGIVHRDIKPSSLFIAHGEAGEPEAVKLLDFGIARMTSDAQCGEHGQELTGSGVVAGSAEYMPPEHARGEPLGRRSDIYSLGIVAYEMLTGRVPFTGATGLQVIARHLDEAPQPPRELEPSIPADVEAMLLRMIAKEPSERFASMAELEQALRCASDSRASSPMSAASVSRASAGYRTGLTSERPRASLGPHKTPGALRSLPRKPEPLRAAASPIPIETRGRRTRAEAGAIIGDYELVRRIGRGGMAEVWVARKELGQKGSKVVALKMIADHYVGDERYTRMFRAEAELAAVLSHGNIVQVFDEGEDDGRSYFVMEWVDGLNLLKLGGILALLDDEQRRFRVISYIIGQLLHALHYAHSITSHDGNPLGIVHRDVSPQNVLVSNHGEVKLTDFGVAFYNFEESSGVHVKGKVRYMAPEQLAGQTRSPAVDLYAVGALLHELLEGRKFRGEFEDGQELLAAVLSGTVPAPVRPIPPELDRLRVRLLDPEPTTRVQSAEEAIGLLQRYPGYGDARSELTKLCSSLTGVMRPRMGPRDSSQALSMDQRTTRWAGQRASAAPPPARLVEKVLPRLPASMQTGSMTVARGSSAKAMGTGPLITGHTEMLRPDIHPPSMVESEVFPDRTATLVMMQTTTGWRPASIVEESVEHGFPAEAPDGGLHRARRSIHDAGIFMEVVTGTDTEQEILPSFVPGDGSSTVRQIPCAVATQTRVVRIVLSRAVVAVMGAALVLLMGLSVSLSWLMFHGREDVTELEPGDQPTMPERDEPTMTAVEPKDAERPRRRSLSVAGTAPTQEGYERAEHSAAPSGAAFQEASRGGVEDAENGRKRKLGKTLPKIQVVVAGSSDLPRAQARIGRRLVLSVGDREVHRIPAGSKTISWRKGPHEPWIMAGTQDFLPDRDWIVYLSKEGPMVLMAG